MKIGQLLGSLDALGENVDAERMPYFDSGLDDLAVILVMRKNVDKALVDHQF